MKAVPSIIIALAAGFVVGLILTEALRQIIFFSIFVGLPAAVLVALFTFLLLYRK